MKTQSFISAFTWLVFAVHLPAAETPVVVELKGHTDQVTFALFSPDGKKIVTTSQDKSARIWDAESGRELRILKGHKGGIHYALFSPDGTRIVTASGDETARIWDVESGKVVSSLVVRKDLGTRLFSTIASVVPDVVHYAAFSSDGKKIVTACKNLGIIRIWEVESGKELKQLKGNSKQKGYALGILSVDFSPDAKKIISGHTDGTVRIWDAESGKELKILEAPARHAKARSFMHAAFSPDGTKIIVATKTSNIAVKPAPAVSTQTFRVLDAELGKELQELKKIEYEHFWLERIAFSPDGRRMIATGNGLYIWDVESGKRTPKLAIPEGERIHTPAAFSPNVKRVVTTRWQNNVARIYILE